MASIGRGRPRTDALRQKSVRVFGEEGSVGLGVAEDALRVKIVSLCT